MANVKIIIDGKEQIRVVPESFFMAKAIDNGNRSGYSLKCVLKDLVVEIYYKSGNFFDRKSHLIGKLYWDINTDIVMYHQYGSTQKNDCISVWKDIANILRENDVIKVFGKTKKSRKVYCIKVHNDMQNHETDEKFLWIPKRELCRYLTKER